MNERIRELIEQATKHYPATETSGEFSTFDKEKFAELVIKQCLAQIEGLAIPQNHNKLPGTYTEWNLALGHAKLEVLEYFFGSKHE